MCVCRYVCLFTMQTEIKNAVFAWRASYGRQTDRERCGAANNTSLILLLTNYNLTEVSAFLLFFLINWKQAALLQVQ